MARFILIECNTLVHEREAARPCYSHWPFVVVSISFQLAVLVLQVLVLICFVLLTLFTVDCFTRPRHSPSELRASIISSSCTEWPIGGTACSFTITSVLFYSFSSIYLFIYLFIKILLLSKILLYHTTYKWVILKYNFVFNGNFFSLQRLVFY